MEVGESKWEKQEEDDDDDKTWIKGGVKNQKGRQGKPGLAWPGLKPYQWAIDWLISQTRPPDRSQKSMYHTKEDTERGRGREYPACQPLSLHVELI